MKIVIDVVGVTCKDLQQVIDDAGWYETWSIVRGEVDIPVDIPTEFFADVLDTIASIESYKFDNQSHVIGIDLHPESVYISQTEISPLLGVTRSAVSNWIRGVRGIRHPFPAPVFGNLWLRSHVIYWPGRPDFGNFEMANRPPLTDELIHMLNLNLRARHISQINGSLQVDMMNASLYHPQ